MNGAKKMAKQTALSVICFLGFPSTRLSRGMPFYAAEQKNMKCRIKWLDFIAGMCYYN